MSNLFSLVFRQLPTSNGIAFRQNSLYTLARPYFTSTSLVVRNFSSSKGSPDPNVPADVRERARLRIAELEAQQSVTPNSPLGILDRSPGMDPNTVASPSTTPPDQDASIETPNVFAQFPDRTNPITGEVQGPTGPEPTRFGDWERKGRCSDF